jgi:hypothetical protein
LLRRLFNFLSLGSLLGFATAVVLFLSSLSHPRNAAIDLPRGYTLGFEDGMGLFELTLKETTETPDWPEDQVRAARSGYSTYWNSFAGGAVTVSRIGGRTLDTTGPRAYWRSHGVEMSYLVPILLTCLPPLAWVATAHRRRGRAPAPQQP